jgi:hypothetical protein
MIMFILTIMCTPMVTGAYSQSHDLNCHLVTHGVVTHHDSVDHYYHDSVDHYYHDSVDHYYHDSLRLGMTHLD